MNSLARDYILHHAEKKKAKSLQEDQKLLKNIILPAFGDQQVAYLRRYDIETFKMFSLANAGGWREDNPAKGTERYQEEKKDRGLTEEELQALWKVLDEYSNQSAACIFKLLILIGARKGELLHATWDQFDLEKGVWIKPYHLTKQKKKEHLPLSVEAIEISKTMKSQSSSPFLFPGKVEGKSIEEVKKAWDTIRKKSGFPDLRIHDLRHTHAFHLVSSGLSLSIVGKLLGHTQPQQLSDMLTCRMNPYNKRHNSLAAGGKLTAEKKVKTMRWLKHNGKRRWPETVGSKGK